MNGHMPYEDRCRPYPQGKTRSTPYPPGATSSATRHRMMYIVFLLIYHVAMATGMGLGTSPASAAASQQQQASQRRSQDQG
eukprot:10621247-Karenia_brevis.AAC.1